MLNVLIKTESHFSVNRARVRKTVENYIREKAVKGDLEVSISIVGNRMMKKLNSKYRKTDGPTTVLTFGLSGTESGSPFIEPPDNILRLGDIVISYPEARDRAIEDDMLVDEKIDELVRHGMNNLFN